MTDISEYLRRARGRRDVDPRLRPGWTWAESREWIDGLSDRVRDWQGVPIPLGDDNPFVLAEGHPLADFYRSEFTCRDGNVREDERVVNWWYSRRRQCEVYVMDRGGRRKVLTAPASPDRSMDRLQLWVSTMGAADAWDPAAERRARDTLRAMLTERQWHHYDMTGCFLETSPRSRLTYLFRRLRPTIAMTPRWPWWNRRQPDSMQCLAVLCLHAIGYYSRSWGGCMVPSDDVIAHLTMMRGDEAFFWRKANLHNPASPEAGL